MDIYDELFAEEQENQDHLSHSSLPEASLPPKRPLPTPMLPNSLPKQPLRIITSFDPSLQHPDVLVPPPIFAPNHLEALKSWLTSPSNSSSSMDMERNYDITAYSKKDMMMMNHENHSLYDEWEKSRFNPVEAREVEKALVEGLTQIIQAKPCSGSSSKKRKISATTATTTTTTTSMDET